MKLKEETESHRFHQTYKWRSLNSWSQQRISLRVGGLAWVRQWSTLKESSRQRPRSAMSWKTPGEVRAQTCGTKLPSRSEALRFIDSSKSQRIQLKRSASDRLGNLVPQVRARTSPGVFHDMALELLGLCLELSFKEYLYSNVVACHRVVHKKHFFSGRKQRRTAPLFSCLQMEHTMPVFWVLLCSLLQTQQLDRVSCCGRWSNLATTVACLPVPSALQTKIGWFSLDGQWS